jgi:hypothetical protein
MGLHHDWLPADDESNISPRKYYLPKPHEIYPLAEKLRMQRKEKYDIRPNENTLCRVPVRRRSFE